jgi:hypothetical protein
MRGRPERQSPWFLHGLDRHVHFGKSAPLSEVAMVWANVKDSEHIPVLEEFQKQFGADIPVYDRLAALRIEELERKTAPPEPEAEAGLSEPDTLEPETKEPEKENPADYVIAMQRELKRVGCYSGRIDGDWGRQSEAALGRVVASKSLTFPEPVLSSVNLDALRKIENGVCKPPKPSAPRPSVRNDPPAASRTERSASVKTKTTSTLSVCYQRAQRYCANPDNSSAIGYQACMTQAKKGCRE